MNPLPSAYILHPEVQVALHRGFPLVALETAVVTHGLPHPDNLSLAQSLEAIIRAEGAIPATIGVLDGKIHIGLIADELSRLADPQTPVRKISCKDFAPAVAQKLNGGTTVAGTLVAARTVGIRVFATGGIGGVHRGSVFDVSTDLPTLGESPLVVVCAGAKAILDLAATLEVLETQGVPVVGYRTTEFPAFYSSSSGLQLDQRANSPAEVANIARAHWELGFKSAILLALPPPAGVALPPERMESIIQQAIKEAGEAQIHGAASTPFLLARVAELSSGDSLKTNLALLRANAQLAAQVAKEFTSNLVI